MTLITYGIILISLFHKKRLVAGKEYETLSYWNNKEIAMNLDIKKTGTLSKKKL